MRARNSARGSAISNLCLTSHCGWLGCMSKMEKRWSRRRPASVLERVMTRSCGISPRPADLLNSPTNMLATGGRCWRRLTGTGRCRPALKPCGTLPISPKAISLVLFLTAHALSVSRYFSARLICQLWDSEIFCGRRDRKNKVNLNVLIAQSMWLGLFVCFLRLVLFSVLNVSSWESSHFMSGSLSGEISQGRRQDDIIWRRASPGMAAPVIRVHQVYLQSSVQAFPWTKTWCFYGGGLFLFSPELRFLDS